MTRREFSTKSEAIRRIEGWYSFAFIGFILAVMVVRLFAFFYVRNHPEAQRLESAGQILFAIAIVGGFSGMAWLSCHFARKSGLACPKCRRLLVDREARFSLLTGRCPRCGNDLFSNSPGPARKDWLTKEQFKMIIENLNRKFNRRVTILVIVGLILALSCAAVCGHLSGLFDKGLLDPWLAPLILRRVLAVMLSVPILVYLGLFLLAVTKKQKSPGVPCPECGRSIFGRAAQAALEKNICIYCGAQLFEALALEKA